MMANLIAIIRTALNREDGQALSEYGLILGLIAVVCLIALTAIGLAVSGALDSFAGAFGGGGSPSVDTAPPIATG
jgi:pilus assembly protein Flp/PilA